ncbi:POK25 protein, partial [Sula dactylatra]|nr:POK25 protein [Sula dactylatra]
DLIIMDLKDCFFTIPLDSRDTQHFAFSVPVVNHQAPMKRYHWTVLPQGVKNSPAMCQIYVANALSEVRQQYPDIICYHYMDDILFAGAAPQSLAPAVQDAIASLVR